MIKIIFLTLLFGLLAGTSFADTCNTHTFYGIDSRKDQELCRLGYAVGYDYLRKTPRWVAFRSMRKSMVTAVTSYSTLKGDNEIPYYYRVRLDNYKFTNYVPGPLAPITLTSFNDASGEEAHLLSSMIPMEKEFKEGAWDFLVNELERWVAKRGDLFVVTGPVWGDNNIWIENSIGVPSGFFMVAYDPYVNSMIAFVLPHEPISKDLLAQYQTTVSNVEKLTGINLFYLLHERFKQKMKNELSTNW